MITSRQRKTARPGLSISTTHAAEHASPRPLQRMVRPAWIRSAHVPSLGKLWTATLDCPNNEVRSTNFFEIRACRCRQFKCVSEQDKSGMEEINEKGQVVDINQQSVGRRRRR